jgi:hypothetical protein
MFNGKLDMNHAYLDIQSGSGGTEAQDWAEMVMKLDGVLVILALFSVVFFEGKILQWFTFIVPCCHQGNRK